jgi:transposase-like protein
MNLAQISELTESQAREYFERQRWSNGVECPHCNNKEVTKLAGQAHREGVYQCNHCYEQFTVTVGTVMEDSHIPLKKWLMAFHLMSSSKKGISALQLKRNLGLGSYRTAWFTTQRIRLAMTKEPLRKKLRGTVEVDETYIGGKPRKGNETESKRGRGTKKTPVMLLVERDGKAVSKPMKRLRAKDLKGEIKENVDLQSRIITDDFKSYRGLKKEFEGGHDVIKHTQGEYSRDGVDTNTAESYFSLLKRGHYGVFHHLSKEHLHRYCDEFTFRWNHRKISDSDRMDNPRETFNRYCKQMAIDTKISNYLRDYIYAETAQSSLFDYLGKKTKIERFLVNGKELPTYINEYWTSKQRQANSLHEIAYRACFKPQLPRFFIELLTKPQDIVYDPFSGRGTTVIESALLGRNVIANDINPISKIVSYPRLLVPRIESLRDRLTAIQIDEKAKADIDLSMFFHPKTESEIVSLKNYLSKRESEKNEDNIDLWIRMVATNRLTGHSKGFFSVYTLPPNQAVSAQSQLKINQKRGQKPDYRDVKKLILRKSIQLTRNVSEHLREQLLEISTRAKFLTKDSRLTNEIEDEIVSLTVTSPPFLDIVQYANDNWLRCWFNGIDMEFVSRDITMSKTIEHWSMFMKQVFRELFRITKPGGWVAFEVGEIRNGKVKLDEYIVPLGLDVGFKCEGILINEQQFTKTANIWGIKNNNKGTNSNRIVLFTKHGVN